MQTQYMLSIFMCSLKNIKYLKILSKFYKILQTGKIYVLVLQVQQTWWSLSEHFPLASGFSLSLIFSLFSTSSSISYFLCQYLYYINIWNSSVVPLMFFFIQSCCNIWHCMTSCDIPYYCPFRCPKLFHFSHEIFH